MPVFNKDLLNKLALTPTSEGLPNEGLPNEGVWGGGIQAAGVSSGTVPGLESAGLGTSGSAIGRAAGGESGDISAAFRSLFSSSNPLAGLNPVSGPKLGPGPRPDIASLPDISTRPSLSGGVSGPGFFIPGAYKIDPFEDGSLQPRPHVAAALEQAHGLPAGALSQAITAFETEQREQARSQFMAAHPPTPFDTSAFLQAPILDEAGLQRAAEDHYLTEAALAEAAFEAEWPQQRQAMIEALRPQPNFYVEETLEDAEAEITLFPHEFEAHDRLLLGEYAARRAAYGAQLDREDAAAQVLGIDPLPDVDEAGNERRLWQISNQDEVEASRITMALLRGGADWQNPYGEAVQSLDWTQATQVPEVVNQILAEAPPIEQHRQIFTPIPKPEILPEPEDQDIATALRRSFWIDPALQAQLPDTEAEPVEDTSTATPDQVALVGKDGAILEGTKEPVSVSDADADADAVEDGATGESQAKILPHGDLDAEAAEASQEGLSPEGDPLPAQEEENAQEEEASPRKQGGQMNRTRRTQSRGSGTDLKELGAEIGDATAEALGFTIGPNGERNWSYKDVDHHVLLEMGGYLPVVGALFDGARVVAYLVEGDFESAGIAAVEAIPIVGDTIGAGRKIVKVAQKVDQATGGVGGKVVEKGQAVVGQVAEQGKAIVDEVKKQGKAIADGAAQIIEDTADALVPSNLAMAGHGPTNNIPKQSGGRIDQVPRQDADVPSPTAKIDTKKILQGGLKEHEAAQGKPGGHTIEKHIGKPDYYLAERLDLQRRRNEVSTFTDIAVAEETIAAAISEYSERITAFFKAGGQKYMFEYKADVVVGRVLKRGEIDTVDTTKIRIILRKDETKPLGYRIQTGHPIYE